MHADCLRASSLVVLLLPPLDQQENRTRDSFSPLSLSLSFSSTHRRLDVCNHLIMAADDDRKLSLSLSLRQLISTRVIITYTYESDKNQLIICTDADQLFIAGRTKEESPLRPLLSICNRLI